MPTLNLGRVRPVPAGEYNAGSTYIALDVVDLDGSSYIAIQDVPVSTPPANPSYWALMAEKGDQGDQGDQGIQGVQGAQGDQGIQGEQGVQGASWGQTFETISKNIESFPATVSYGANGISQIVYDLGGAGTITKTLSYNLGALVAITLSGNTPSGIDLTKTLTYTSGNLTGIAYS